MLEYRDEIEESKKGILEGREEGMNAGEKRRFARY
jgi:hypothetical protein